MSLIACPYLKGEVDLTAERESHIADQHPELLPFHRARLLETVTNPAEVRKSLRFANARMFARWYADLKGGKHVVVVVVSDAGPEKRHWVVTAYIARKLTGGEIEWKGS